ncbi:MAG: SDR family oxidoreductase [Tannerella sp.]|jgi:NAD(P)H dehydrogenase (quinone)|nr:SDR family oxidoreductase [Tannerella sp.]
MSKILVTGATGHLGGIVVNELLQRVDANDISVLVRDFAKAADLKAKGVNIFQGDYDNYASLVNAFAGIDKLYFVSGSDIANRLVQHENVVKAAVEAKVGHIIYTSTRRKSEGDASPLGIIVEAHSRTEKFITESGLAYTILRHNLYMDILPMFMGKVMETGSIFLPAGDGRTSYASRSDLAAAAAVALTTEGHENKTYEFGGTVSHSFSDIAGILGELSGRTIRYVSPALQAFNEQMKSFGLPDEAIQTVGTFCTAIAQGEFDFPSSDLKNMLDRDPQPLKEFLKTTYQL